LIDFSRDKKALPPGFEPGNPFGNQLSRLAHYQIVPRQHKAKSATFLYKTFQKTKGLNTGFYGDLY
jgi:hypothetical protein